MVQSPVSELKPAIDALRKYAALSYLRLPSLFLLTSRSRHNPQWHRLQAELGRAILAPVGSSDASSTLTFAVLRPLYEPRWCHQQARVMTSSPSSRTKPPARLHCSPPEYQPILSGFHGAPRGGATSLFFQSSRAQTAEKHDSFSDGTHEDANHANHVGRHRSAFGGMEG
ncbi:hypothetical protein BV20DRAFT_965453 [Pilatotrama ljubarskyi]|nr:hypothetical protein BV20DRAFT_965453 [Pilatotrama ljubarskyi]